MTRVRGAAGARAGLVLLAAALVAWPALGAEVHPFYQQLLEDGLRSFERGDHGRAREELRIAAFGLLETPEQLSRALAHLALAQRSGGDLEGFESTRRRLTELESRFGAFSSAALPADVRSALGLAASEPPKPAAREPRRSAIESKAPTLADATLPPAQVCISWTGDGTCRQPGTAAPASASPDQPARPPESRASFHRLDHLSTDRASEKKLRSGFEEASELADRYPAWAEMQRVAAVLATRSGSYADAVRYYDRSGEQIDAPLELFYLSVALFETDQPDAAATVLKRALPTLRHKGEVKKYIKRILNEESAG